MTNAKKFIDSIFEVPTREEEVLKLKNKELNKMELEYNTTQGGHARIGTSPFMIQRWVRGYNEDGTFKYEYLLWRSNFGGFQIGDMLKTEEEVIALAKSQIDYDDNDVTIEGI